MLDSLLQEVSDKVGVTRPHCGPIEVAEEAKSVSEEGESAAAGGAESVPWWWWSPRGMSGPGGGLGSPRGSDGRFGIRGGFNGQRNRQNDGLNPNRQRGFVPAKRIETPTLNDMRARQGAVVGKFLNFMQRKNTVVIELYERAFYSK